VARNVARVLFVGQLVGLPLAMSSMVIPLEQVLPICKY
jgi:hypothetical protein